MPIDIASFFTGVASGSGLMWGIVEIIQYANRHSKCRAKFRGTIDVAAGEASPESQRRVVPIRRSLSANV